MTNSLLRMIDIIIMHNREIQIFQRVMNVTHTIAHENQRLLIIIYVNFPRYCPAYRSLRWLSSRHFNIHGLSIEGKVFGEFVEPFHNTNVRLQRGNASQNAMEKKKKKQECVVPSAQHRQRGERTNEYSFRPSLSHSF